MTRSRHSTNVSRGDSQYRRYFTAKPRLSASELDHFTQIDFVDRVALVVEAHGEFIAWASYERWPNRDDADSAFMVDDEHHGRGIATLLLEHLAAIARSNGIIRFTAEVLAENRAMLSVFSRRVGRCNAASSPASSISTSSSPTRASSSTRSNAASSAPTHGRSPGCCSPGRWR